MKMCVYVCMHACMHACMHVCICVHVCLHMLDYQLGAMFYYSDYHVGHCVQAHLLSVENEHLNFQAFFRFVMQTSLVFPHPYT